MLRIQEDYSKQQPLPLPYFFNYDSVPDDNIRNVVEYLERKRREYDELAQRERIEKDDFLIDDRTDSVTAC